MSPTRPRTSLLRTIGNLDDPLRGDERNRGIWCEAAAVAQQVQFIAAIMVGTVMAWAGGREGVLWSVPVIWVSTLGNVATSLYVARSGIPRIAAWRRLLSPRAGLTVFLLFAWAIGAGRTLGGGRTGLALAARLTIGLILVVVGSLALSHRRARRGGLPDDDKFDDR